MKKGVFTMSSIVTRFAPSPTGYLAYWQIWRTGAFQLP